MVDDGQESALAREMLDREKVDYVVYHIRKFEESCCGDLPTTRTPSVFAPEGLFKGLDGVKQYIRERLPAEAGESPSAYW